MCQIRRLELPTRSFKQRLAGFAVAIGIYGNTIGPGWDLRWNCRECQGHTQYKRELLGGDTIHSFHGS
jgi:hypothetical protein